MGYIQSYTSQVQNVLSTVELTTRLSKTGEMTCDVSHLYQIYICIYIIHIYNSLENSLEKATRGVLQKIISENSDPVKVELYSLQLKVFALF